MAERNERGSIARLKGGQRGTPGRAKMIEPFAGHAIAHVERQDQVDRNLLEADEIHWLPYAVIEHLEVSGRQPLERHAAFADQDIDGAPPRPCSRRRAVANAQRG